MLRSVIRTDSVLEEEDINSKADDSSPLFTVEEKLQTGQLPSGCSVTSRRSSVVRFLSHKAAIRQEGLQCGNLSVVGRNVCMKCTTVVL